MPIPPFPKAELSLLSSEREILRIVRNNGVIARSAITNHTHLAQQSVYRLVEGLIEKGLLSLTAPIIEGRGKPSPQIAIDAQAYCTLGVAISTNNVKLSAVNPKGELLFSQNVSVDPNDRALMLARLGEAITQRFSQPDMQSRQAIGLGVSMQGYRMGIRDRYNCPPQIGTWCQEPLDQIFSEAIGLPAFSENNSNCGAIAEHYCGDGGEYECIAYLSFDHGLGSALLYHGAPFFGGHGNAGELTRLFEMDERTRRPALGELLKRLSKKGIELSSVFELARKFDPDWPGIDDWIEEVTPAMRLIVRAIIAIGDPNAIFFGGEAPDALRKRLVLASAAMPEDEPPRPVLRVSAIEGDASSIGAAILPLQHILY